MPLAQSTLVISEPFSFSFLPLAGIVSEAQPINMKRNIKEHTHIDVIVLGGGFIVEFRRIHSMHIHTRTHTHVHSLSLRVAVYIRILSLCR